MERKRIRIYDKEGQYNEYQSGITLLELSSQIQQNVSSPIVAATVNYELKDLQTELTEDCQVEFFDMTTQIGAKAYQRSLTFLLIVAARELFPDKNLTVEHSLGSGIYCELQGRDMLTAEDVLKLSQKMQEIIAEERPIVGKKMEKDKAIALLEHESHSEHVQLLQQLQRNSVTIYYCGDIGDYFFGTMVPHTGYLETFAVDFYKPGLLLRFPTLQTPCCIPEFIDQPKLAQIFLEAERWGGILRCGYVSDLNEHIQAGKAGDIVRVAEALHEKKLAQIADRIAEKSDTVRVILVSGPSSSGKTTFAHRLNIQLRVNGIRPVPISLDDYFVDRDHTPRDEEGKYDFEALEAIDIALFNQHLTQLLQGEAVEIPTFNFITGQREYTGHIIKLEPAQPLIIEGIHGLNERLTASVPREQKFKIYISALTQLSLDSHNRIPTTDARLLRRIVRDSQFRSHDALGTLRLWASVRRGEEKNIFPYQEDADMMFNSALIYELSVLKKYAEPLLQKVKANDDVYLEAKRLLKFLSYFYSLPDEEVPNNSILKEFIGQSCFFKA